MKKLLLISLVSLLSACSNHASISEAQHVSTFYDYQLHSPKGQALTLNPLPQALLDADVILVGEWHTHSGIHRFQTDLLQSLYQAGQPIVLSMEQFTRDNQELINQYLAGEIGEQFLMKQAAAWPNYESDYRPLIEVAKSNQIDVIAANAPKQLVRCIGRKGLDYLEGLNKDQRQWVASNIDTSDSPYKEKFMASMHHGSPEQTKKQFAAQITWDETMAESITQYLTKQPDAQILHIAGKFHTEGALGTAQSILRRSPDLNVVVITPTSEITQDSSDFQLEVLDPPARYIKKENRMQAYHSLSNRNSDLVCD